VLHKASKRSLTYGKLAAEAAKIKLDKEPEIKKPGEFKLLGKPLARLDTPVKVNGSAKFGIDSKVEGMVYAAITTGQAVGAKVVSVDDNAIRGKRGIIKVVKLEDAVAVVADNTWRAQEALNALKITWDQGAAKGTDSAQMKKFYRDGLNEQLVDVRKDGDAAGALAKAGKVIEATYEVPHLAHAPMEPLNATVKLTADRLDVWLGTQSALSTLQQAAEVSGLKQEQVFVHNAYLGGGFGRRSRNDEMRHAVLVAKDVGKPVKLTWDRPQDLRGDRYRPQAAVRFRASLASDGKIAALETKFAVGSINRSTGRPLENGMEGQAHDGLSNQGYKIPDFHVAGALKNTHLPVSFWRSVGGSQNCFFFESFIDELAYAAGKDPLEFRRAMLDRKDFLAVINKLEEVSNWKQKLPARSGKGRGIAITLNHGSVVGHVAEVTVDAQNRVRVDKVFVAVDCYNVVNPKIIEAQMESGAIYGLTAALYGEITVKDGEIEQRNFDTYRMLTMAEAPRIEVHLTPTGGTTQNGQPRWGGIGECGTAPIAPALTNAIFAATGKRVRELPLKNVKLAEIASL